MLRGGMYLGWRRGEGGQVQLLELGLGQQQRQQQLVVVLCAELGLYA